jgi:hypothetical protein
MADNDIWNCAKCKKEFTSGKYQGLYDLNSKSRPWVRLCDECYVHVWNCPIKFVFEWGLPEWVEPHMKSLRVLEQIRQWFRQAPPCIVHFVPRELTESINWNYHWEPSNNEYPQRDKFSYRGFCRWSQIVVIVDSHGIETPESIEWITYHELGHHECQKISHMADTAWDKENKNEGRVGYEWKDDKGHEADSEERHVNRMATAFMGGKEYARPWWRKRVNAFLEGKPIEEFPDCHAEPIKPVPLPASTLALQNLVQKKKKTKKK